MAAASLYDMTYDIIEKIIGYKWCWKTGGQAPRQAASLISHANPQTKTILQETKNRKWEKWDKWYAKKIKKSRNEEVVEETRAYHHKTKKRNNEN